MEQQINGNLSKSMQYCGPPSNKLLGSLDVARLPFPDRK
jgi:hypothetical protein